MLICQADPYYEYGNAESMRRRRPRTPVLEIPNKALCLSVSSLSPGRRVRAAAGAQAAAELWFITAGPTVTKLFTGTRDEPDTLTQGAPVFPGSSRHGLGIEPKSPGWLVQDRTIGDPEPTGTRADLFFITAVPITKLFAWGRGVVGGHVL
jgi:hypothetical protein